MKTMGLSDLALVAPREFPSPEASARASGADDVLADATLCDSLQAAIGDCGYVVGASARLRGMRWPVMDPRRSAETLLSRTQANRVALVFGPEQSGLTNEDLGRCHALVHIPTDPDYGSLNLAMAVQVLCYELRMAALANPTNADEKRDAPLASAADVEGFHQHLEQVLSAAGFLHADHPKQLKLKLRRLFHRARLDQNEINILRGMVAALDPQKRSRGRE